MPIRVESAPFPSRFPALQTKPQPTTHDSVPRRSANLLDGSDALERFERHAGFEFGFVSSSFCFHFVWFRFG
jgi:hypothetical protein